MKQRIVSFTRFCENTSFHLTPAQYAFAAVAYDGLEPRDLTGEHRDLARRIFGEVETIPPDVRAVVVMLKGRDVGGTRMAAWFQAYRSLVMPLRTGPGELVFFFYGAPKLRLAHVGLRFALDALRRAGANIIEETGDYVTILREDGRRCRHECFAASRGGDNTRGVPIGGAVLTEAAFYLDEDTGVVNDTAIFSAMIPRLLGTVIVESTPWAADSGLLATEFSKNHGNPISALAAHCPTLVMRNDAETAAKVARERERDPDNARREFDAEFVAGEGTAWPADDVRAAFGPHEYYYLWREPFAIIDAAESCDTFTYAIMRWGDPDPTRRFKRLIPPPETGLLPDTFCGYERDEHGNEIELPRATRPILHVWHVGGFTGPEVREMGLARVVGNIANIARNFGARQIVGDDRAGPYLEAMFSTERDVQFGWVAYANKKHDACVLVRSWFRDKNIVVCPSHDEMLKQCLRYKRRAVAGGYRYGKDGEQDDYACLLVTLGVHTLRASQESRHDPRIDLGPAQKFRGGRYIASGR